MSRRKGRILAFQALFAWDAWDDENKPSIDDLLTFSWLDKDSDSSVEVPGEVILPESAKEERTFASLIIAGTIDHIDEIDSLIKSHLSATWTIERLNKIALALLRIGTYEIKYQHNVSPKIIIDEAVNIAKDYGSDDSYKFINAVLDKIGKDETDN